MDHMNIAKELKDIANILQKEKENQIERTLRASELNNLRLDNICRYARDIACLTAN